MDEFFEVPMSRRGATTQRKACAMPTSVPAVLAAWLQPFAASFTPAVWRHVLVLVAGVVLAPGRRTITAALRVMGLDQGAGFAVSHRVLSLGRWSSRAVPPGVRSGALVVPRRRAPPSAAPRCGPRAAGTGRDRP